MRLAAFSVSQLYCFVFLSLRMSDPISSGIIHVRILYL